MSEPEIGATAAAELVVRASDLASAFRLGAEDAFPPVFATARMVALMELASARLLYPFLAPSELSVGTTVDVVHSAATPEGARVIATARYAGKEGKQFLFDVVAHDGGGEIGRARHRRAAVGNDRLVAGARRRNDVGAGAGAGETEKTAGLRPGASTVEGLTHPRGLGLERSLIRARENSVTQAAWRLTVAAEEGPGSITLVEAPSGGATYRGEGVCLGWTQDRLASAYAILAPRDAAAPLDTPQLG